VLFISPDDYVPVKRDPRPAPDQTAAPSVETPIYPLVFIGPMASGKSKIGRRVARALRVPFIDTDSVVVAEHGAITDIFAQHGEEHFRRLERRAVSDALRNRAVVSLGGGAVLDADTQADLRRATVVSLTTTAAAVRNRSKNAKRPLLAAGPDAWQRIYDERRPIYEALASIHFDSSTRPVDAIAADIVKWVKKQS